MEFKKIWKILLLRKWIVIQALSIITLTSIIVTFLMTPRYTASAKIYLETSDIASSIMKNIGISGVSDVMPFQTDSEIVLNDTIKLATSEPVLAKVISLLQLRDSNDDLYKPNDLLKLNFITSSIFIKPSVEITRIGETNLLEIKATSIDAMEVAMISNTLAEVFLKENLKQRNENYRGVKGFIENQIQLAKAEYQRALGEIKEFKIAEKTLDLDTEIKKGIEKMVEMINEKEDTIMNISEISAKIETLKDKLSKQDETVVSSVAISENPLIADLKKKLLDLKLQLSESLREKTEEHVDIQILKSKIDKANEELREEMKTFQSLSNDLQELEMDLAAQKVHLVQINKEIDSHNSLLVSIPELELVESQLNLRISASQELYSSLLQYLYQIGIVESMTLSNMRLIETARQPDEDDPVSPNVALNIIFGSFLGLVFGLGLAFIFDYLDSTIKTPQDVRGHGGFKLLATLPVFSKDGRLVVTGKATGDPLLESFRRLKNSIKFSDIDKQVHNLLITSCRNGEGKTTTAVNLGISFSREGKKVLIVDTSFYMPVIHELFGISESPGIIDVLYGQKDIKEAVQETDVDHLSILPAGTSSYDYDTGRVFESRSMRELIENLSNQYDVVIFDSPPVFPTLDTIILAGCVDSTLIVIECEKTPSQLLSSANEFFEQAKIKSVRSVLNKYKG
jgi:capsular exopolysaccharide synthesis family protein